MHNTINLEPEKHILSSTAAIKDKYQLVNELNSSSFNIFTILNVHTNERFTHSAFIAELLNTKGSHCQGSLFLDIFLSKIHPECQQKNWVVKTELYTGSEQRGYLDIFLEADNEVLIIENKIYAGDGENQLKRYENYALDRGKTYTIFYLTIDGVDASKQSSKNLIKDYTRLSYCDDIHFWLEECIKMVSRKPVLRETIHQYLQVVNLLCGVPLNHNETMELKKLLKENIKNFEAANSVQGVYKIVQYEVKQEFWLEVVDRIKGHLKDISPGKWDVEFSFDQTEKYPGITVRLDAFNPSMVAFKLERLQDVPYYGITKYNLDQHNKINKDKIHSYQDSLTCKGFRISEWWFAYKYMHHYNFTTMDTLKKLFSSSDRSQMASDIAETFCLFIEANEKAVFDVNSKLTRILKHSI